MNFLPKAHTDTYPFISPANSSHTNNHILITGASKGIGLATALSYARAGAAAIAIAARSDLSSVIPALEKAAVESGKPKPKIFPLVLDVLDRDSVEKAAVKVKEEFGGRLDVVVNNAGYLEKWLPITESDPEQWWRTWEVNIRGTYLVTRSFLPLLLSSPQGSLKTVINVTSAGALRTFHGASAYQSSKFAVLRLTEFIVAEYGSQGILSYTLHPGGVVTDLAGGMPKAVRDLVLTDTAELGADTMVWLSAERREWLAGRYVNVQWDMEELVKRKEEIVEGDKLKMKMVE